MASQSLSLGVRRLLHRSLPVQIGLILGVWLASEAVVRIARLPLPAGAVGMAVVLALLWTRRIRLVSLRRGADWFLAEMLLFFVPAVLAVTDHHEFFGVLGLKVLAVILVGTLAVMAVTAAVVDLCCRWTWRRELAHAALD
ncbi:MAG: CidA/LrgA family protein [Caulobacteraceae bacterium]